MKKLTLFVCLLMISAIVQSQTVPATTGSNISQSDAQAALDYHNKVRKDVGVEPLEWSAELSAFSQEWANYLATSNSCNLKHRPHSGEYKQLYGENIFWGSGADYRGIDASKSWYDEIKDYKHEVLNDGNWYKAGHYTQMVWRNTKKVGIGVAKCSGGGIIIVANYDPPGNYLGEKAY